VRFAGATTCETLIRRFLDHFEQRVVQRDGYAIVRVGRYTYARLSQEAVTLPRFPMAKAALERSGGSRVDTARAS
jgi:hypothetical protein